MVILVLFLSNVSSMFSSPMYGGYGVTHFIIVSLRTDTRATITRMKSPIVRPVKRIDNSMEV